LSTTKDRILERAAAVASTEGLDGLSIGRLADDIGMSKAGVYGHFGSKERLQIETIDHVRKLFYNAVVIPAEEQSPGLPRLRALCSAYLTYVVDSSFPERDFFATVANEFDTKPGAVRDAIAAVITVWMQRIRSCIQDAVYLGQLGDCDVEQLAFELEALMMAGHHVYRLNDDPAALDQARAGILARLESLETPNAPDLEVASSVL
jgi:AcrR family transcriptional regulator